MNLNGYLQQNSNNLQESTVQDPSDISNFTSFAVGCTWTNWLNRDDPNNCCDDEALHKVNPCSGIATDMEVRR